jgi:hypothetical protein
MHKAGLIILFFVCAFGQITAQETKSIIFITAPNQHAKGEHEYKAGCHLLAKLISENIPGVFTQVFDNGWPADSSVFDKASSIVLYCNGGERHLLLAHLEEMNRLMNKGIGLVALHNAVEAPKEKAGVYFLNWLGGYFETWYSVNPRWKASIAHIPNHEITYGVNPFNIKDEWYYHIRFSDSQLNFTPILETTPSASSLQQKDGPYKGNELVRKALADGEPQILMWAYERTGAGRSIGFTGAHYFKNWRNDGFRKLVLNAIAWTAGIKIPTVGIYSPKPTRHELNTLKD